MTPLSAIDAISPAWIHTRHLLLGRRDVRLYLKLAAVAFFAELGGGSFNFSSPGRMGHGLPPALSAVMMPILIAIVSVGLVIGLGLFYVGSRLQLVLFDLVLRGETLVAPVWRRYGPATWRWIGVKLLLFLGAFVCLLPVLVPGAILLARSMGHRTPGAAPGFASMFLGVLGVGVVFVVVLLAFVAAYVLLRDFGLPSMALEATPARETFRRLWAQVRLEPGPVALFLLMRFVLGAAGALTSWAVLIAAGFVAALPLGSVGLALWAGLHKGTGGAKVLMVAGWVLLGVVLAGLLVVGAVALFGFMFVFLQAYAIFFLAGRYPLLAAQLRTVAPVRIEVPQWPQAFYPPPTGPSPV